VLDEADTAKILEYCHSSLIIDLARSFPDMRLYSTALVDFCIRCMKKGEVPLFCSFVESISRIHGKLDFDDCLAAAV
jgi:hypothetical protein